MIALERAPGGKAGYDHVFIVSVLLLTGLGLVTLWTASASFSQKAFNGDGLYIISRQALLALAGLALFFAVSRVKIETARRLVPFLILGSMALCVLTFVPGIGMEKNGALRWIRVGSYSYQPSEAVKIALPLYLAHLFDKKKDKPDGGAGALAPPVIVTVLFFIVIYAQNNFSDSVFIAANALLVFWISGARVRYIAGALAVFTPVAALLVLTKEYRLLRVMSFLWPADPLGADYQARASELTINSGGFWGKGIGQNAGAVSAVPEVHSDFIFAAYAEEAGFLGVLLFFALLTLFAVRGYRAALRAADMFSCLLAFSYVTLVVAQSLLNIGVVSGAIPVTGVPLPFFSAGGSSLATTLAASGFIANVSRRPRAGAAAGGPA